MSAATSAIADIETSASYVRRPFDFDMRAVGGLGPWPLGALGGWFGARTCWGAVVVRNQTRLQSQLSKPPIDGRDETGILKACTCGLQGGIQLEKRTWLGHRPLDHLHEMENTLQILIFHPRRSQRPLLWLLRS